MMNYGITVSYQNINLIGVVSIALVNPMIMCVSNLDVNLCYTNVYVVATDRYVAM